MTAVQTPQRPVGEGLGAGAQLSVFEVHDALGRAHYERMARDMAPALTLPRWEELGEGARADHRKRMRWLLPVVVELTRTATERAHLAWLEAS